MMLLYNIVINKSTIVNDYEKINTIKKYINMAGCICIKVVQWSLPRIKLLYPESNLINELGTYYDDCNIHNIEYTNKIYKSTFNEKISNKYTIIKLIGSGSVGQVYLIKDKNNKLFAMKVLHPNIDFEYFVFILFYKIIGVFIDYKYYLPVDNLDDFIYGLKDQLDLNIEYNNNLKFKELYNNCELIKIPEIYKKSKNILIMEYFDKLKLNELESVENIYKYNKYISILTLFIFNNAIYGFNHGDLHKGNYLINNGNKSGDYKLYVIDYGYCYFISEELFIVLFKLFNDTTEKSITSFYDYLLEYNSIINKEIIQLEYNTSIEEILKDPDVKHIVTCLINFTFKYNLILPSNLLNIILLFLNIEDLLPKYTRDPSNKSSWELLNICESHNAFEYYTDFINKNNYNDFKNYEKTIFDNNFNKFENFKKYL